MIGLLLACLFGLLGFRSTVLLANAANSSSQWIQYGPNGTATMTHYTLPQGFVAACGCVGDSTNYPTAAMSQMAYGSSAAYGPACGRCFNLTLLNSYTGDPPFFPNVTNSVVVKVTDHCPLSSTGWCDGTVDKPNQGGQFINFDLVYPSNAIPTDFFPTDVPLYGYSDFGVWNVSYESVDCSNWAGWADSSALGSDASIGSGGCCPVDPGPFSNSSQACPSYSDDNGLPPDTVVSSTGIKIAFTSALTLSGTVFLVLLLLQITHVHTGSLIG